MTTKMEEINPYQVKRTSVTAMALSTTKSDLEAPKLYQMLIEQTTIKLFIINQELLTPLSNDASLVAV